MNAILSIKPQFVDEIMAGRKKFEFRKQGFKRNVRIIYIYASSPVCRIVGEFELGRIIEGCPGDIWEKTSAYSGISKHYFDQYFTNHPIGFALEIRTLKKYKEPVNPYLRDKTFKAPQSFCYIDSLSSLGKSKETELQFESY